MEPENVDIESITDARRKAIEQTIEPIGTDELKSLGEKLFPFLDHPWRNTYFQFLEDNSGSTFYHATTNDQVEIIYCPDKKKGIWFVRRGGMGPLQAKGIGILNAGPFSARLLTNAPLPSWLKEPEEVRAAARKALALSVVPSWPRSVTCTWPLPFVST